MGNSNVAIGSSAGLFIQNGSESVYVGTDAGRGVGLHDKSKNTMIGFEAGKECHGDGNVFLGYQAGYSQATDNKLYIDNSDTNAPLIYGDFFDK